MLNEKAEVALENRFRKIIQRNHKIHNAYMLIHSEKQGIHLNIAEGKTGSTTAHPKQPYFIASVDKLFTSVLIGSLEEQGKLSYDDSIALYLKSDLLSNMHIYKGKNYTNDIKIKHLLNHTSGLSDFVEDRPNQGKPMIDRLLDEPSRSLSPQYIIQWSKENLTSRFPPGKRFHYSDTGYLLLGLIIEKLMEKPFHEALNDYIFRPLEMNNSYMLQHSEPAIKSKFPVADCYIHQINITQNKRLGIDDAGGRIVATSEDLLKFMKALVNYQLLRKETMEKMKDWAKFSVGIDYGYGLMNFKHVPILMPRKFNGWGNAGSTGSFMYYHPELDAYFIGSLNHFRYHRKGIVLIFKMIDTLLKNKVKTIK